MAVTIRCPNLRCRKVLLVPESTRGKRVRCAYCETLLVVPLAYQTKEKQKALATAGKLFSKDKK
ncbi:MAG: hypothetical protein JW860_12930 [Sedimentisphaerales bacterium]|nr:hypothetical protein [Sedimentisphaerales bacterium]